jgi:hypothetical protein
LWDILYERFREFRFRFRFRFFRLSFRLFFRLSFRLFFRLAFRLAFRAFLRLAFRLALRAPPVFTGIAPDLGRRSIVSTMDIYF